MYLRVLNGDQQLGVQRADQDSKINHYQPVKILSQSQDILLLKRLFFFSAVIIYFAVTYLAA